MIPQEEEEEPEMPPGDDEDDTTQVIDMRKGDGEEGEGPTPEQYSQKKSLIIGLAQHACRQRALSQSHSCSE